MSVVAAPARIVRHSAAIAYADFRAIYTPLSWTVGWLGRMLAQVTFFTSAGYLFGRPDQIGFLVVGNAVMSCVIETMMVVASTCWERETGTLPLLAAAPGDLGWVFFGRSLQWPVSGTATSAVALFALAPLFGVHWTVSTIPLAVLILLAIAFSSYCLGLVIGAVVLNAPGLRNIASNVAYLIMMAICGVEVPVGFWPAPVQAAAQIFPLTHGLAAIRSLQHSAPFSTVLTKTLAALAIGVAWLAAAVLAFRFFAYRGRKRGSFDFGA